MINLSKIIRSNRVSYHMPKQIPKEEFPLVTNKLLPSIRSKVFNYKTFINNLDKSAFTQDELSIPCDCENSPFKDPKHDHIITGDLRKILNNKLRKLISMGPKFREPKTIDFTKAKSSILSVIDEFITKTSEKLGIHKNHFLDWKNAILESIDYRVKRN